MGFKPIAILALSHLICKSQLILQYLFYSKLAALFYMQVVYAVQAQAKGFAKIAVNYPFAPYHVILAILKLNFGRGF